MIIYIGADHRGFSLKKIITQDLKKDGHEVVDCGDFEKKKDDDYPDFARAVAEKVAGTGGDARGIVICGSGFGVDIVANKFSGVRSALAMSAEQIRVGRHDDNVNVLSLAADFIKLEEALNIVHVFLSTSFEKEDRYSRRLGKITELERGT